MYCSLKALMNYLLISVDDHVVGHIDSVLFDEGIYGVRFLVFQTANWSTDRQILLSPDTVGFPNHETKQLPVSYHKKMIESSPGFEVEALVSSTNQQELVRHYGWPIHWSGMGEKAPGVMTPPHFPVETAVLNETEKNHEPTCFPLRRSSDILGYRVLSDNKVVGRVDDFILEIPAWMLRFFVIKKGFIKHKRVLIVSHSIKVIDFDRSALILHISKKWFERAPRYKERNPIPEKQQKTMRAIWDRYQI